MKKAKKLYYSIGEVENILGETNAIIRYWIDSFKHIKPHRSAGGTRQFTQEDIDNLKIIQHLIRNKGLTVSGAKKELKRKHTELEIRQKTINKLQGVLEKLERLRTTIQEQV